MDKTPGQALCEKITLCDDWDAVSPVSRQHYEELAQIVIDHVRPQIEAEAYKKALTVAEDYNDLTYDEWIRKYGANLTLIGAIRALAEGK